jgi:hypothetical protein
VELEDWVFFFLGFQALTSQVFVILNTSFVVVTIWFVVQLWLFSKEEEIQLLEEVGEVEIIED